MTFVLSMFTELLAHPVLASGTFRKKHWDRSEKGSIQKMVSTHCEKKI